VSETAVYGRLGSCDATDYAYPPLVVKGEEASSFFLIEEGEVEVRLLMRDVQP
jgi:hypothetical protein